MPKKDVSKIGKSGKGGRKPGAQKTGGRKKGTPNKKTAEKIKAIEAGGIVPLDYMLAVMRDEDADPSRRDQAAKDAAPYCHPKLSAVEHTGKDGGPMDLHWTVEFIRPK